MANLIRETANGIQGLTSEDILFSNREIFLTTPVDVNTCTELMKQLMILEKLDQEKEITFYINSPGGEVGSGMAVYDYIRMMKAPVRTVCIGMAASMGAMLFLAGDKREMFPHTKLMIHDPAYGSGDMMAGKKPDELQQYVDDLRQIQDMIVRIIAEKTGKSVEEICEKTRVDSYFNATEAVKYGLATGVCSGTNTEFPEF